MTFRCEVKVILQPSHITVLSVLGVILPEDLIYPFQLSQQEVT